MTEVTWKSNDVCFQGCGGGYCNSQTDITTSTVQYNCNNYTAAPTPTVYTWRCVNHGCVPATPLLAVILLLLQRMAMISMLPVRRLFIWSLQSTSQGSDKVDITVGGNALVTGGTCVVA